MAGYDAFISYSHAGDGRLAPRLQSGLERYARPWWKRRILRVFRDETGLSASPHLWSSIVEALNNSDWFVVLASPEAAASEWVGREIQHWAAHRDPDHILMVVTDGTFSWNEATDDVDWANSSAAHPALHGVFGSEPRYIDLTWARGELHLDRREGRFQDALAELAAPMRGIPKDDLAGEDVRQHRRTMRLARAAAVALALLTTVAVVASVLAIAQRNEARDQKTEAQAQRVEAETQRVEAETQRAEAETQRAEAETQRVAAETQRAEAETQHGRADDQALLATARGTSTGAIAQAGISIDRSLLLGAAAVGLSPSDESLNGLLASLESASSLVAFHHETGVVAASDVSPDGQHVATLAPDGRVQVWSIANFEPIAETMLTARHPYSIEYVGSGDVLALQTDANVIRLDATTLQPIGKPIAPSTAEVAAAVGDVSSDGSVVAVGQLNSPVVEVFDTATGLMTSTFSLGPDCRGGVRGLDVSTQTNRVAVVCISMTAMYDLSTGELVASRGSSNSNGPLFSPDGRILAVGYTENLLVLLDTATFAVIDQVDTPGTRVYTMDFSQDGEFLAVGSDSGDVAVYSFVPDYRTFDFHTGVAQTWTAAAQVLAFGGLEGGVLSTSFVPSPTTPKQIPTMIVGGPSGLSEWDQSRAPTVATALYRVDEGGWALLDPQSREVYRVAAEPPAQPNTTEFEIVDLNGAVKRRLQLPGDAVSLLAMAPDSTNVVATATIEWPDSTNGTTLVAPNRLDLQIADSHTGTVATTLHLATGHQMAPTPDAVEQFAIAPEDYPDGHYLPLVWARLSPDGAKLLVRTDDTTSVWDTATGALIGRGSLPIDVTTGGWGVDSTTIVSGTVSGALQVSRADDLTRMKTLDLTPGWSISDIEPLASAKQLLVTSENGTITVVDAVTFEVVGAPFQASGIQLQQTAVDQAGETVAALDRGGTLRLWRFDDRSPVGPPLTVIFSPGFTSTDIAFVDGGVVVSELGVSAAFIPLGKADLATRACQLAARQLTSDEWLKYVGDRPQVACS